MLTLIHGHYVYGRRVGVLSEAIARRVPPGSRVLDVGSGDGLIASLVQGAVTGSVVEGVDTLVRPETHIPVRRFDGVRLPYADRSFDVVLFVDVLHHADDPAILLREAARVSRHLVLIKDHRRDGLLAQQTLHFMDWVGNARHGVVIPANYWPERQWRAAFREMGLTVSDWTADVPLYPAWASWIFGRSLHFVASLRVPPAK